MIKSLSLLTRKPELSKAEFRRVWEGEHAPLVHAVPEVRRYVLSFVVDEPATANAPIQAVRADAVAELWYDDMDALKRAAARPQMQAVLTNGAKYLGAIKTFLTEEVEVIGGEAR